MSRKHFEMIARVLRESRSANGHNEAFVALLNELAEDFAEELATTNPNFDRARFLKAAGKDN